VGFKRLHLSQLKSAAWLNNASAPTIRVYQYGQQVGQAEYDSRWGGGRVIDKFINAEKKITELTNQLFPNGAAGLKGVKEPEFIE